MLLVGGLALSSAAILYMMFSARDDPTTNEEEIKEGTAPADEPKEVEEGASELTPRQKEEGEVVTVNKEAPATT